eukprot:TRINITY_DN5744_c1_g2_i1.p1 TRINITY_DN5744_c1_g2~~TRINITY_DN5744_c1_g2_i1.p1  ORF type:complete len:305 (+),score=57.35 TRINITY_DN5744_c1_g2_i1:92-1006(+)
MADKSKWIVIDIGSATTKVGIVGEGSPRFEIETEAKLAHAMLKPGCVVSEGFIQPFIRRLVTEKIHLGIDRCHIMITTNTGSRLSLHDAVRSALPTSTIINTHAAALACSGFHTGLVIDIGHQETRSIPIFEGTVLEHSSKFCNLSSDSVKTQFTSRYQTLNDTTEEAAYDFLIKGGRVNKKNAEELIEAPQSASKVVKIPLSYPFEVLFDGSEPSADSMTLQRMVVETIEGVDLVQRRPIASNIVIMGGVANTPGMTERIAEEVSLLGTLPSSLDVVFSKNPFRPSYRPVIGGMAMRSVPLMM